jgi:hypothetical protein
MKLLPILALLPQLCCAAVTQLQVRAIIQIESGGNPKATGDKGAAAGAAQFHRASWSDTSRYRAAQGLPVYPYSFAYDLQAATSYLHSWLTLNAKRFTAATGRQPSTADLYAIHQLGFNGYAQRAFDIQRCPAITQRKTRALPK